MEPKWTPKWSQKGSKIEPPSGRPPGGPPGAILEAPRGSPEAPESAPGALQEPPEAQNETQEVSNDPQEAPNDPQEARHEPQEGQSELRVPGGSGSYFVRISGAFTSNAMRPRRPQLKSPARAQRACCLDSGAALATLALLLLVVLSGGFRERFGEDFQGFLKQRDATETLPAQTAGEGA